MINSPKRPPVFIMPTTSAEDVGPIRIDGLKVGGHDLAIARPAAPERLLDLGTVAEAYAQDEYMPYWATFWPVSQYLAEEIAATPWPATMKTAIELGCGLGLPGIVAALSGLAVTLSDYDATAVQFALDNAQRNGAQNVRGLLLDWRQPPDEVYDLIIASDLIYEERNVRPLVALFETILAPQGLVLVADQDRPHAALFREVSQKAGFTCEAKAFAPDKARGRDVTGTVYWLRRSNAKS